MFFAAQGPLASDVTHDNAVKGPYDTTIWPKAPDVATEAKRLVSEVLQRRWVDLFHCLITVDVRPSHSFLPRSERMDHVEGASTRFMVASGGVRSEGYGHGGPGVCLGDGQTEAEGIPSQGGRGDALLRRMSPSLT